MAEKHDRAVQDDCKLAQQADELPYLCAIVFAAGKDIGRSINSNMLRFQITGLLIQAIEKRRWSYDAIAIWCT